ncbi:MAG TPA: class I SAM-dependent methyltransferase [Bacteroidales bacterium]|nr:class I SAM-dependent methyltransferase [Bacteroidales bacterium]
MFKRLIAKNFRKPEGLFGRYIIKHLKKNQTEYDELDPLLKLNKDDKVLEIGFGIGKGIYDFSQKYDCNFHGIDFSRLMYSKASRLNRDKISSGKVVLHCTDFDDFCIGNNTFNCIYLLNVIYFWEDFQVRLVKIYSLLKQDGKVIIFMADSECFKDSKQAEGKDIFYIRSIYDVVSGMEEAGFKDIETTEHTTEKMCYYITAFKR